MAGEPVTYTTREGDTWDAIAARELGNATLGSEIAGLNGFNAHGGVPVGVKITIPHRFKPAGKPSQCSSCDATIPAGAAYCSSCGAKVGGGKVARRATSPADPPAPGNEGADDDAGSGHGDAGKPNARRSRG